VILLPTALQLNTADDCRPDAEQRPGSGNVALSGHRPGAAKPSRRTRAARIIGRGSIVDTREQGMRRRQLPPHRVRCRSPGALAQSDDWPSRTVRRLPVHARRLAGQHARRLSAKLGEYLASPSSSTTRSAPADRSPPTTWPTAARRLLGAAGQYRQPRAGAASLPGRPTTPSPTSRPWYGSARSPISVLPSRFRARHHPKLDVAAKAEPGKYQYGARVSARRRPSPWSSSTEDRRRLPLSHRGAAASMADVAGHRRSASPTSIC
jgi:hypothetical protein